jgi:hypothetical protein
MGWNIHKYRVAIQGILERASRLLPNPSAYSASLASVALLDAIPERAVGSHLIVSKRQLSILDREWHGQGDLPMTADPRDEAADAPAICEICFTVYAGQVLLFFLDVPVERECEFAKRKK